MTWREMGIAAPMTAGHGYPVTGGDDERARCYQHGSFGELDTQRQPDPVPTLICPFSTAAARSQAPARSTGQLNVAANMPGS